MYFKEVALSLFSLFFSHTLFSLSSPFLDSIASSISVSSPPGSQPSWPALSRAHKHIFCDVCQLLGLAWLTPAQLRLQFFCLTTAEPSGAAETIRWSPAFSKHFLGHLSGELPSLLYILPLTAPRWLFLPSLEGPERGLSGLVRKWEPYCGYLLFHLSPPFALESRGTTGVEQRLKDSSRGEPCELLNPEAGLGVCFYTLCVSVCALKKAPWRV